MSDHPETPRVEFNDDGLSLNIEEAVEEFRRRLLKWKAVVEETGEAVTFEGLFRMRPCDCEESLSGRDEHCPLHGDKT
jgi:hypothetical protein